MNIFVDASTSRRSLSRRPEDVDDATTTIAGLVGESDPAVEKLKALTP